jgi:hypothetical protein
MPRQQKITLRESAIRPSRRLLIYCGDHHCARVVLDAVRWDD